jgi:hypothetical protein
MVKLCNTPNGISEPQATTDWKIYPNPSSGMIHLVASESEEAMITVTDYTGRIIHRLIKLTFMQAKKLPWICQHFQMEFI